MVARRPRMLTVSEKEALILELLSQGDQMYGLQLVAASRRRLKRGNVLRDARADGGEGLSSPYHLEDAPSKAAVCRADLPADRALGNGGAWRRGPPAHDADARVCRGPCTARAAMAARCAARAMERVIDSGSHVHRKEHRSAMRKGRRWRSRWVRIAGYFALMKVVALCA